MPVRIFYQCEICNALYEKESDASNCEKQGEPKTLYDKGFKFGVFEVRSKRIKAVSGIHLWCYDVRREGLDPGIWDYLEFTEKEIEQHL
jgi:hypothetical protein